MTAIAKPSETLLQIAPAAAHPGDESWAQAMAQLAALMAQHGAHASRTVVLVPYAQLMQQARLAWSRHAAAAPSSASFVPRFETTMNWAGNLPAHLRGAPPSALDVRMDVSIDILTAAGLLAQAGFASQQNALAGRVVEAAWSLARVASAIAPDRRQAWAARLAQQFSAGMEAEALALESVIGRVALAWAAASSYPSDPLFQADVELLVVLQGFQAEPLTLSLQQHKGDHAASIALAMPLHAGQLALHAAKDAEDEAQRAAACVLAHLAQGRSPVALIAQDRVLTRRIRAMLAERGVALRDETGWKLSTTRAAAALMSLLRALAWDASTDQVLDWLKNAPAFEADKVTRAEIELRKAGIGSWRAVPLEPNPHFPAAQSLAARLEPVRSGLQKPRPLSHWLRDLRAALQQAGQWLPLETDVAGLEVLQALRLQDGSEQVFATSAARMGLQDFTQWVNQALEAASFSPAHPPVAQVVILPLSQLLGRPMQAVVLPGCDEVRLPVSPEPPGLWTPAQRLLLGLPPRDELAAAQRQAWLHALTMPHIDILWRTSEAGERLMPSGFVQELMLLTPQEPAADPRELRSVAAEPTPHPMPTGETLPVDRLSASAYEDLRRCPYRFFALRQLRLQASDELDGELGKRDFGNWLHTLLNLFHETLKDVPALNRQARVAMIDDAAAQAAAELALSESEFLPFLASWPRVREGYLEWLDAHEASGARYEEGEAWKDMAYGDITLFGKIDRIDRQPDGHRLVIDYKTEATATTKDRVRNAHEDTQLAFYAALLSDDTLGAAYVNLGEREATRGYPQEDIVSLRDDLISGILTDMARIKRAVPLPALGEGKACEYCSARGLCRKDFWTS